MGIKYTVPEIPLGIKYTVPEIPLLTGVRKAWRAKDGVFHRTFILTEAYFRPLATERC